MRPDAPETVDLDGHLPARLFTLSARISQHAQRANARPLGLDMCEWRVVQILGRDGASTINEAADRIAMDRGGTSRAISRLEKRGLIYRLPQDADRRRSRVDLTESGHALHEEVARFANAREQRLTRGLSAQERTLLAHLLARLETEAQAMQTEDWHPGAESGEHLP
ncbi:MAG: MarR family transcriptional regulator [Rhodobacter sp.]|nr:MarR family transcriptional regulator [Paracoccaceae bacterium]MCC0078252.1 MarR family transcriptional regulator [Rhodobacter sp.]